MSKNYFLPNRILFCLFFLFLGSNINAQAVLDISGNFKITYSSDLWWQYHYKPTGSGTYNQSATITNSSSALINLNPFISWDFGIRNYNFSAGYFDPWGNDTTVNSEYASIVKTTGYTFDFNTPAIQEGWRGYRLQNTTSNSNSDLQEITDVNGGSLYMGWEYGNGVILVSPKINDLASDKKFSIDVYNYQGSHTIVLGTITNPYDPTTFHPLKTVNHSGTASIDVFFNNYVNQDQYIAIKSSGNYGDVYLDNFSYQQSVNCFDLTNVNVSNIQEHSAQLNFNALGQTIWEVSLKNLRTNITTVYTTNSNPYTLNDLSGNTNYQIKIRANCATGLYSNWSPTLDFTTTCENITAGYNTSFADHSYIDPCWKTISNYAAINQSSSGTSNIVPRTGSKMIEMKSSSTLSTQKSFLITPYIQDLDNNKRIKFFLIADGRYNDNILTIGTMSNPNDTSTFIPLKTIMPLEMNEVNGFEVNSYWKEHIVYLDNYNNALNHHYLALKQGNLQENSFYIDDFTYENTPVCKEPVNLKVKKTGYNFASVEWENHQPSTEWQIEYGPLGFTHGNGTLLNVNSNPFTINSNLSDNTEYDFYVRSKCGNSYSNWSDRGAFKTRCYGFSIGYTSSFETDNFLNDNTCWRRLTPKIRQSFWSSASFITNASNNGTFISHTGTKCIRFMNELLAPDPNVRSKSILVSPRLLNFNNFKKVSFWVFSQSTNSSPTELVVGTLSDPDDSSTFISQYTITNLNQNSNQWKYYEVDFSSYTGNNEYVGIKFSQASNRGLVYIDDFEYSGVVCTTPNSLSAHQTGQNSATLGWNSNNTITPPNSWQIEYGPLGFIPGTGTLITANLNPYEINNLNGFVKYEYRVRSNCQNTFTSDWSERYPFKISCGVNAPFYETFDQYDAALNNSPSGLTNFCWTSNDFQLAGVKQYNLNNINSSPNSGFVQYFPSTGNGLLISPYLSDFNNTKRIKFWMNYYLNDNPDNISLIIGTIRNPVDPSTFDAFQTIPVGNIPKYGKEFVVDFSQYTGENKHIAFKINSNSGATSNVTNIIYLDNIYYDNIPTCYEPTDIKFLNINNNSVDISWNNINAIQNVQIEYGIAGFTLGTGTIVNSNSNELFVTNLQSSTLYDFYFRTTCSSGQSILIGAKKIQTACDIEPLPWIEDFNDLSQYEPNILPNCFKNQYGNFDLKDSPQIIYSNNSYNNDHLLNGYNDSTYLHFYNNFSSKIITPMFDLTVGTTYKFSLKARKSYEYSPMAINASVGRGQEEHYLEANLKTVGSLTEYQYNGLDYYFTPIESGDYNYLLNFKYEGSVDIIADNFELKEGYENIITDNTDHFDFQNGNDNKLILESTQNSLVAVVPEINNVQNKLLKMAGSALITDWKANTNNLWADNQNHVTKVNMKIDASAMTALFMAFDLKQTFNDINNNSKFRVVINGIVVGNIITPVTTNQDTYNTFEYDLTPFVGGNIKISLQHLGKSSNSFGDNAYLDNLKFSPTPLLSIDNYDLIGLKYYPNPVTNILNIENNSPISSIEIFTITGQSLFNKKYSANKVTIDINDLSSGVYFVKITVEGKNKTLKVIKE